MVPMKHSWEGLPGSLAPGSQDHLLWRFLRRGRHRLSLLFLFLLLHTLFGAPWLPLRVQRHVARLFLRPQPPHRCPQLSSITRAAPWLPVNPASVRPSIEVCAGVSLSDPQERLHFQGLWGSSHRPWALGIPAVVPVTIQGL